ncbi:MAG: type II restriction endonuclease [Paracoccaceae bacterium]
MKRGVLADYFAGVGVKRLSAVDANPVRSNQHEIGTTREMRKDFLGENHQQKFPAIYVWLGEDQDGFTAEGWATHYDARLNKPDRAAEWRLYYPSNPVTETMQEGDTLFLAKDRDGVLWFIVAPAGSTSEQQLFWLFGLRPEGRSFVSREVSEDEPRLDFAARFILDELGIEFEEPDADKIDSIIEKFGTTFPPTAEFSQLARLTLPEVRAEDDPDAALVAWLDHEEAMFRRLEHRVVAERLGQGFIAAEGVDVDGFIKFSLGVQNRRKSRMGHSLENHIAAIFDCYALPYERGAMTEHGQKPDFLFPSRRRHRWTRRRFSWSFPCLSKEPTRRRNRLGSGLWVSLLPKCGREPNSFRFQPHCSRGSRRLRLYGLLLQARPCRQVPDCLAGFLVGLY